MKTQRATVLNDGADPLTNGTEVEVIEVDETHVTVRIVKYALPSMLGKVVRIPRANLTVNSAQVKGYRS